MSVFFIPDPDDVDARYLIELDRLVVGAFRAASGLKSEREILEVDEGGRQFALARIGPYAEGHFTLEDGETDAPALFEWFLRSSEGEIFSSSRHTGDIIYMDGGDEERMRWRFRNAQITEWLGPAERPAPGETYQIARLGISHEGLEPVL